MKNSTGIIVTEVLDPNVFTIGSAWHLKLASNYYVNAILIHREDKVVKFTYWNEETLEMTDVVYNMYTIDNHDLIKWDYEPTRIVSKDKI